MQEIKKILDEYWDPIGIYEGSSCGFEEYEGYAAKIAIMLTEGKEAAEIESYLKWAESHMGLTPRPKVIKQVVRRILASAREL